MTAQTTDLVTWFGAVLDEEERIAREVERLWAATVGADTSLSLFGRPWHWNPARVLAEVAAKRAVLDDFRSTAEWADQAGTEGHFAYMAGTLLDVLRILAVPYRDRPGYLTEWEPQA